MKKLFLVLILSVISGTALSADQMNKPNIVIIFNDDQGYQDVGCYGSPDIKTPRTDQLAAEGVKLTDFYAASPVCSPSRASLLTGCYPNRIGVGRVFFPNEAHGLNPKYVTIPEVLKTVGYKTKAVGKWHLGSEPKFLPTNQGFDSYYGIPYSNDMYPAKTMKYADDCLYREGVTPESLAKVFENKKSLQKMKNKVPLMRNEECIEFPTDQTTITQRLATEGIKFINESVKEDKPFFLYLANPMPHTPLFASPNFLGKSERGLYGDVVEEIDYNVGRILDEIKKLGIEENTIVIYSSDNGPWLIRGENGGSALPLFEGKATWFEGGQRVPGIIKWPAKIPTGSVCKELASTMDLLPTFAHITGAALPTQMSLDGKNIIDLLTGKEGAKTPHEFFFYSTYAVRSGDWKYHAQEKFKVKATRRDTTGPTLYNLKDDIGESKNVINQYPEIAARLKKVLLEQNSKLRN
ncbi:sulfatase [Lentisphaera marina]|uniref:sulfatase family protein n=1 Tax=Lentisphaera marina TaxID=1111041 RepID=UPI0023654ABD|nr:sulfatase [Lentisphaera marina]MDD7987258.1 sulfatase [Lentisphaera marina]